MSSLSLFSVLPQHIVRRIVHYVTSCFRLRYDGAEDDYKDRSELLTPLLWVCRNFRDAVYSIFSSQFYIRFSTDPVIESGSSWHSWPHELQLVCEPSFSSVKTLSIVADTRLVYSGNALKMAQSPPLQDSMFPSARSLVCTFILSTPYHDSFDRDNAVANICAFVEHVKRIAPMANKVSIRSNENYEMKYYNNEAFFGGTDISSEDKCFGALASRFYQLANRISYTSDEPFAPMELQLDLIHGLVSLECESEIDAFNNIVLVARQSAQTLQKLTLAYQLQAGISDLVQSSLGNYVEYPCLSTLFLDLQLCPRSVPLAVDNGTVLFPSLRNLAIGCDYPFGDDVLFRGNAATLEFLRVMPGRDFCDVVRKYKVFTPTSHPRLQKVEGLRLSRFKESQILSTEAHLQCMLSIAPKAAVRVIPAIPAGEVTLLALDILKDHPFIQVLHLADTQLMLWEVIHIVKWLPILSDLVSKSTGLGAYSEDVTLGMIPDYVRGIEVPLRERFRCWRIGEVYNDSLEETLACILVVAMMFPNFSYANLPNSVLHKYMRLMEETLGLGEYVDAAPRLRHLLFDKTV